MQLPPWLKVFFAVKDVDQTYRDDRRYTYILILLTPSGKSFNRTFSTSSPLNPGHRIVLAAGKTFTVTHIVHVRYNTSDTQKLTRPTTFVHAGILIDSGPKISDVELSKLGFNIEDKVLPYTLH